MNSMENSYTQPSKFTIIQNNLIRSSSLSCKAFKLLCIGLSHSGKWSFYKSQIATCFKEGKYTLDEAMKELREIGYLYLKATVGEGNKFSGHQWFWFSTPINEEEFKKFYREVGFQELGGLGDSENIGDIRKPTSKKTKTKSKEDKYKDNVLTMPSSINDEERKLQTGDVVSSVDKPIQLSRPPVPPVFKSADRFIKKLSIDQRKVHDQIVKYIPLWGSALKSDDVCAWFLSKKWTAKQVHDAFIVYRQDADEARCKGRSIDNAGGAIVAVIKSGRSPKNASFEANKQMAISSSKGIEGMEAMDKYVKFRVGNDEIQINYDLPTLTFSSTLSEYKRKAQNEYE